MTRIAGVDGCKGGWLMLLFDQDTGGINSVVTDSLEHEIDRQADLEVVTIDIPIGLTETGPRHCDVMARKNLGPRASSVFPAPIRASLACTTYDEAAHASRDRQQKGISKQSFAIYPKIREIDELLCRRSDLRDVIYEVHPEVCFQAWNGGNPMRHPKKASEGVSERLAFVSATFGRDAFPKVRSAHRRGVVADDDILDAFAAVWTAGRILRGEARSLPPDPRDEQGLSMVVVY